MVFGVRHSLAVSALKKPMSVWPPPWGTFRVPETESASLNDLGEMTFP
jgi:hypothetical protein